MPPKRIILYGAVGIVLAALMFLIIFGDDGVTDLLALEREKARMTAKADTVFNENISLYRQIDRLRNDAAFIEATARKELGVVRKDELILKFSRGE